jgi:AcrR family transcriptional regulator
VTTNEPATTWREQAVARSLDSARTRAEHRVQRFLDAAIELMNSGEGKEFTVQEVVERSGQSLRSFYQYFGGKHELLLALFEESVRSTAELLRKKIGDEQDPLERLHVFVVEYYRLCRPASGRKGAKEAKPVAPVMVDFAQQLLTAHPDEASRAFVPIVQLFNEVLGEAAEAGAVRDGVRSGPIAGIVLEAIMFNAFSWTIGGTTPKRASDPAEELWDLVLNGFGSR